VSGPESVRRRVPDDHFSAGNRHRRRQVGNTAFLFAAKSADVEVMRLLVENGADPKMEVLERKFSQRPIDVRAALQLFAETFTLVTPDTLDPPACRDREDDVVLATALAGDCAAVITGDEDLLILNPFRSIHVLAPSAFWKWESEHE